jgi:hypothetical protein
MTSIEQLVLADHLGRGQGALTGGLAQVAVDVEELAVGPAFLAVLPVLGQIADELHRDVGKGQRGQEHGAHEDRDQTTLRIVCGGDAPLEGGHGFRLYHRGSRADVTRRTARLNVVTITI